MAARPLAPRRRGMSMDASSRWLQGHEYAVRQSVERRRERELVVVGSYPLPVQAVVDFGCNDRPLYAHPARNPKAGDRTRLTALQLPPDQLGQAIEGLEQI